MRNENYFDNIKRSFSLSFLLWWVIAPNTLAIFMWPIGGPSAFLPIAFSAIIGAIAVTSQIRFLMVIVITALFLSCSVFYLAVSFNLHPFSMAVSAPYIRSLNLGGSTEYLVAGTIVVMMFVGALKFGPNVPRFNGAKGLVVSLAYTILLLCADISLSASTRGHYKNSAPEGIPVTSAVMANLKNLSKLNDHHLIIVMVESWGLPSSDERELTNLKSLAVTHFGNRYDVEVGKVAFYGSTTDAEMRELCYSWGDHLTVSFTEIECLPKKLKSLGFRTQSIHTFHGQFFEREKWYPEIGFEQSLFKKDLIDLGVDECPGMFAGACDDKVPNLISNFLKNSEGRQFIYWLTVNSHLPIPVSNRLKNMECEAHNENFSGNSELRCRTDKVISNVFLAMQESFTKADFPDANILIVGDHVPPFFPRSVRTQFSGSHVPWIMLSQKN